MFAGHIRNLLGFDRLHQLVNGIEFIRIGQMGEIARVQDKIRRNAGVALMRAIACLRCHYVLVDLATMTKPMCESLIWTKLKLPFWIHAALRPRRVRATGQKH